MKPLTILFSTFILVLLVSSCGGSKDLSNTDTGDIPEWYLTTPTASDHLYEAASSTSRDMDLAISKASTEARAKIARSIEVKVNSMQKKFEEEVGEGENSEYLAQFTQATKTVVSKELSGSQISKKKLVKDGKNWRAYVLAKYPIGEAQKAFLNQISNNKNLYTRFRATEAFAELENDVDKYDNPNAAQITNESQIESPQVPVPEVAAIAAIAPIADAKSMVVDHNNFTFALIDTKFENRNITSSFIITNNAEDDEKLSVSIYGTKIFDEAGNETVATKVILANSESGQNASWIDKQLISGVPTPAEFTFEKVSSNISKISLLSIALVRDKKKVEFRNIEFTKQ
ncbi:MAG: hypothetical protein PF445_08570 [Melioribacteraceae bacterium]|jgi:hypothetical protein|nr:hypothetical protein [Melioribacteraceae bacterium]